MKTGDALWAPPDSHHLVNFSITLLLLIHANVVFLSFFYCIVFFKNLKSATIIQYTIKGRFMSR